jgi:DNA-binding NtrC family response regulator
MMLASSQYLETIAGKVVVVEDDDLMQALMVEILTELGGSCTPFVTADDALMDLLKNDPPILVVTDFTLPGQLDGREFALMVNTRWPSIPVILTSGFGSEIAGKLPDNVMFLQKPWSVEQMVAAVSSMV